MSALRVRPARGAAEYLALVSLWRGAVDTTHDFLADADRDEIEAKLQSDYFPAVTITIAESGDRLVGFLGVLDGTLEMLFVDAGQRGRGIGTALLTQAVQEHGVTEVDVNEQNSSTANFYTHRGFEIIGRSETDQAGRPYPLLQLRLRSSA